MIYIDGSKISHLYKSVICSDGSVGAAGPTVPTKGHDPPLRSLCGLVLLTATDSLYDQFKLNVLCLLYLLLTLFFALFKIRILGHRAHS